MDRRDAMALSGSGSYYIQRGISGSGPPTQPTFHGSQGIHPMSNSNPPFGSNTGSSAGFGSPPLSVEHSPAGAPSSTAAVPPHVGMNVVAPPPGEMPVKRKRGRPRKYGQDGSVSLALSPSVSTMTPNPNRRGRGRPPGSGRKQRLASIGDYLPSSSGMSFTPHVITVSIGEDIAAKVSAFSQQGPRAICILSASGAVSTATLHQSSSSPVAITYEGRFEILSLSASYLVTSDGSYRNRAGNLSVSLASPDGRVIGGGIGGPLVAASVVQVIVGSFIWAAPKVKNKKREEASSEVVQDDTTNDQTLDDNSVSPVTQLGQNIIPTSVGMWSTGSRPMDMRHAHMDIDLMRG
ncbi:PREDICTED: AT-hook motif nuclear-localized protein 9-like [Tarenaya hassleriana]|uniref:AT-hook motif nuclear-localized protein 9-like n=1 Tax=Tarenaya hassleriana TaxID=28532 RepID=UPI00053C23C8|nr:PREDICTED: AT-hook motif nuclear-localized protein 9-like [Tarenaya hassleriana]